MRAQVALLDFRAAAANVLDLDNQLGHVFILQHYLKVGSAVKFGIGALLFHGVVVDGHLAFLFKPVVFNVGLREEYLAQHLRDELPHFIFDTESIQSVLSFGLKPDFVFKFFNL